MSEDTKTKAVAEKKIDGYIAKTLESPEHKEEQKKQESETLNNEEKEEKEEKEKQEKEKEKIKTDLNKIIKKSVESELDINVLVEKYKSNNIIKYDENMNYINFICNIIGENGSLVFKNIKDVIKKVIENNNIIDTHYKDGYKHIFNEVCVNNISLLYDSITDVNFIEKCRNNEKYNHCLNKLKASIQLLKSKQDNLFDEKIDHIYEIYKNEDGLQKEINDFINDIKFKGIDEENQKKDYE